MLLSQCLIACGNPGRDEPCPYIVFEKRVLPGVTMQELTGRSIIGFGRGESQTESQQGFNPTTGEHIPPTYYSATVDEVDRAAQLADQAFATYSRRSGREKATFLRKIAENIESIGQPLVDRATAETGLPAGRIQAETGRTCAQLRMFADLVEEGSWVDARIDRADGRLVVLQLD